MSTNQGGRGKKSPTNWLMDLQQGEKDIEEPAKDPKRLLTSTARFALEDLTEHHIQESPSFADFSGICNQDTGPLLTGSSSNVKRLHHHKRNRSKKDLTETVKRPVTPPAQKISFLLGDDDKGWETGHQPHPLFLEMEELFVDKDGNLEWKETARWLKFEEDVEDGGNRWSKPHVATLNLHDLLELRSNLRTGTICLDMEATTLEEVADLSINYMVQRGHLPYEHREFVKDAIMKRHRHLHEGSGSRKKFGPDSGISGSIPMIRSLMDIGKWHSFSKGAKSSGIRPIGGSSSSSSLPHIDEETLESVKAAEELGCSNSNPNLQDFEKESYKLNMHFMKKIPKDAEAANVLVGELSTLEKPVSCFIRLNKSVIIGDLTEDSKRRDYKRYHEVGRAFATVLSDEVYLQIAYRARNRDDLLAGLDEFLGVVTVIPPGEWDPSIRIEPPQVVQSQEKRLKPLSFKDVVEDEEVVRRREREEAGLVRSGKLFAGLVNDVKRKLPWYWSDFVDGFNLQCLASMLYVYIAVLAPVITFGGLLGDATEHHIAVIEALIGGMMIGIGYGLFSGQPLSIIGPTGPILVFETIIYGLCKTMEWEFLPFRFWIGLWVAFFLLVGVATEASALVCFITRFTEENFAFLIAVIFLKSSIEKLYSISKEYPIHPTPCTCEIVDENSTSVMTLGQIDITSTRYFLQNDTRQSCSVAINDTIVSGLESTGCHYVPNVFVTSILLFFGTFLITTWLKKFKSTGYFPAKVRSIIADFSVIIALILMTLLDYGLGVATPKLDVPSSIQPSVHGGRSWVISPLGSNPWWSILAAAIPALLATILVFMDQQITVVIVNRKEHKLKKGCGYHLDLLIVAIMVALCGIFGFPFCEASTVPSIVHVKSLMKESECSAPGEKPRFLGIYEQRITHIMVFFFVGLSVFLTPLLSLIPMPVLFGVFLYMGVASLDGLQFFDRLLLVFMPKKYQPDFPYLRRVPLTRVHLFTAIQLVCFGVLWAIKDIKQTAILFPIMLVFMVGVRKCLDFIFDKEELRILDDIFPSFKRSQKLDLEDNLTHKESDVVSVRVTKSGELEVPMFNGNVIKIKMNDDNVNITEEMEHSAAWKSLEGSVDKSDAKATKRSRKSRSGHRRRHKKVVVHDELEEEDKIKAIVHGDDNDGFKSDENEEEDQGIQMKAVKFDTNKKGDFLA